MVICSLCSNLFIQPLHSVIRSDRFSYRSSGILLRRVHSFQFCHSYLCYFHFYHLFVSILLKFFMIFPYNFTEILAFGKSSLKPLCLEKWIAQKIYITPWMANLSLMSEKPKKSQLWGTNFFIYAADIQKSIIVNRIRSS